MPRYDPLLDREKPTTDELVSAYGSDTLSTIRAARDDIKDRVDLHGTDLMARVLYIQRISNINFNWLAIVTFLNLIATIGIAIKVWFLP